MFTKFPKFTPLSISHKRTYDNFVASFPPYSDILFSTLHIWWNLDNQLAVSMLNDNLIINYILPGDKQNSGLGLVGNNQIEKTVAEVFKHLGSEGRKEKLVHVPEFTAKHLIDSRYSLDDEPDYCEYVLDGEDLAEPHGKDYSNIKYKINRFMRETKKSKRELKALNLSHDQTKEDILQFVYKLEKRHPPKHDMEHVEHQALKISLYHATQLDIHAVGLYIDDDLVGVSVHDEIVPKSYYIGHHLKTNYDYPGISEYMCHELAKYLLKKNIRYLNIEMDLGIENLRLHKMSLRPIKFLRKYEVKPGLLTKQ